MFASIVGGSALNAHSTRRLTKTALLQLLMSFPANISGEPHTHAEIMRVGPGMSLGGHTFATISGLKQNPLPKTSRATYSPMDKQGGEPPHLRQ